MAELPGVVVVGRGDLWRVGGGGEVEKAGESGERAEEEPEGRRDGNGQERHLSCTNTNGGDTSRSTRGHLRTTVGPEPSAWNGIEMVGIATSQT